MSAEDIRDAVLQRFPAEGDDTAGPQGNEFVVFSKPELGRLTGPSLAAAWDLISTAFSEYAVTVHRASIITGPELESAGAMQQHYGVINQISRLGREALTEAAEAQLQQQYGDVLDGAYVLGGHQFLEAYPEVSPFALAMLFSNAQVGRLGPGTYAGTIRVDGQTMVILNGFHPRQLSFFTADDTVCAFLHCSSGTDWEVLRSQLIGATDPAKADPASIRGTLYGDPAGYGLQAVNSNFNGVHMSAGPLEGLAELRRFFGGASLTDWTFGQALASAGATGDDLEALVANPVLDVDGERGTAFDLTEGVNADVAAPLLVGADRVA